MIDEIDAKEFQQHPLGRSRTRSSGTITSSRTRSSSSDNESLADRLRNMMDQATDAAKELTSRASDRATEVENSASRSNTPRNSSGSTTSSGGSRAAADQHRPTTPRYAGSGGSGTPSRRPDRSKPQERTTTYGQNENRTSKSSTVSYQAQEVQNQLVSRLQQLSRSIIVQGGFITPEQMDVLNQLSDIANDTAGIDPKVKEQISQLQKTPLVGSSTLMAGFGPMGEWVKENPILTASGLTGLVLLTALSRPKKDKKKGRL